MLHSGDWERNFCLVFFYSEQILCQWKPLFKIRWSHFLQSNLSLIGNHFLLVFLNIPAGESSFSEQWKRIFLMNPSISLVESEFLSIGNSILLFTAFFLLVETIISSKICFHQPKKDFFENYFSTRRKKNWKGSPKNGEKRWFPLAGKSVVHQQE